ncbi:sigma-70 family RNA polymerase sigma factor [bacterium SCSIO 12741]|nr:sigma-70 family RNA polymerase sigma factor [bacterium SCSIO 12741]
MEAVNEISLLNQDEKIRDTFKKEEGRLLNFIRKRVPDQVEAEDILQDVFYQLVEAYRLMKPIEQVTAWLFTVARNRITDGFRKKKALSFSQVNANDDQSEEYFLNDVLGAWDDDPESQLLRQMIMDELDRAISELPPEQQEVFRLHELEGITFREISENTGISINTLLSRKRYAIQYLRSRLRDVYEEFMNT